MDSITIVGAGGIGCAVGYVLAASGVAVTFVDADLEKVNHGSADGLRVDRRPPLPARFVEFADWRPESGSVILLCTKCYDNAAVLARIPAAAMLVPIQNGFDPALVARGGGVEGVASFISECLPHRPHTRLTRRGKLHLGTRGPSHPLPADLVRSLASNSSFFQLEVVADVLPYKYTKLMYNAAISPLAAAAGLDNGELLRLPQARRLFFALLAENYSILRGAGIPLGKIGPFHPDTVARILRRPAVARSLAWAFYPSLRRTYCSMSGDLPDGRTEIDYYNRHLIDLAGDRPCPLNRQVYELVKGMERERVPPGLIHLNRLAAA